MKPSLFLILVLLFYSCHQRNRNPKSEQPEHNMFDLSEIAEAEWISIFNGKNLEGWHVKTTFEDSAKEYFKVIDGAIDLNSVGDTIHDYMWLMSDKSYTDFAFKLEFKVYAGVTGNTGVQFRSKYTDSIAWLDGPQVDICIDPTWRTGMIWDETRGNKRWIFPDLPSDKWVNAEMASPDHTFFQPENTETWGKWNELAFVALKTDVYVFLNNKPVTVFEGEGVLNSNNHKEIGVGMKGQFALQIHKNDEVRIAFRKIYLAELE